MRIYAAAPQLAVFDHEPVATPARALPPFSFRERESDLRSSLLRARLALLDLQNEAGSWCGEVTTDWGFIAKQLLAQRAKPQAADELLDAQLPTGGWERLPGHGFELETSLQAYVALRAVGHGGAASGTAAHVSGDSTTGWSGGLHFDDARVVAVGRDWVRRGAARTVTAASLDGTPWRLRRTRLADVVERRVGACFAGCDGCRYGARAECVMCGWGERSRKRVAEVLVRWRPCHQRITNCCWRFGLANGC